MITVIIQLEIPKGILHYWTLNSPFVSIMVAMVCNQRDARDRSHHWTELNCIRVFQTIQTWKFKTEQTYVYLCNQRDALNRSYHETDLNLIRVFCFILINIHTYCSCTIITRSWFETALNYKLWVLDPTFLV